MYRLNKVQINDFNHHGYLLLEQVFDSQAVNALRQYADKAEQQALRALKNNSAGKDFVFSMTFFTSYLNRLLHFHRYGGEHSLFALGHPRLLGAAQSLCGDDFVPTIDMMIFKHCHNHAQIPWHQDLIYPSEQYNVATFGIYLDDSQPDNGAVQVLPGSQKQKHDICEIMANPQPDAVTLCAKAGDVLIHNPMMVHRSGPMSTGEKRRTLYYEFRPLAHVKQEPQWTDALLTRRLNLLQQANEQYRQQFDPQPPFILPHIGSHPPMSLAELYAEPLPFNSANICAQKPEKASA